MLTSIDQQSMANELRVPGNVAAHVVHLARMAQQAGFDGVIASPIEIDVLADSVSQMKIVTPGIRPKWAASQDQKRVMTPADAISKGAYAVVIGRAITKPPVEIGDPVKATNMIIEEIVAALSNQGII
jgi:orotidine-5'-phosphate decarboxylase